MNLAPAGGAQLDGVALRTQGAAAHTRVAAAPDLER
jgi:hypothetical protein